MKLYISAILAISLLSACTHLDDQPYEKAEHNYQHVFTSVGYAPIEAQLGDSFEQKVINAIKASKLEAYKEMAEQIYGALIASSDSSKSAVLKSDVIDSKVRGLVRGARVLRSYHEGDIYITELELDMQTLPYLNTPEFKVQSGSAIRVKQAVYY